MNVPDIYQCSPEIVPQCVEIEKQVLGGALSQNRVLMACIDNLSPEQFYLDEHKVIYGKMLEMFNAGKTVDLCTIGLADSIDPIYIASLTTDNYCGMGKISGYCKLIADAHKKRCLIEYSRNLISDCMEKGSDVEYASSEFSKKYFSVLATGAKTMESVGEIAKRVVPEILSRTHETKVGLSTGLHELDEMFTMSPTDLIFIAGRPGMGKTALAMNIAESATTQGGSVLVFSMEMSREQIVERLLSQAGSINNTVIKRGVIETDGGRDRVRQAQQAVASMDILVDDSSALQISKIRARAMMQHARKKLGLIIIDYLQLATGTGENRNLEISGISGGLKALAKDLKVPVIALSQLNRSVDSRPDKRPMISDLRDSGSLEQDGDAIIFAYRDEVYNKDADNINRGLAELILAKNRHGSTGKAVVAFKGEYTRFDNQTVRMDY